jgi:hypothetical protein
MCSNLGWDTVYPGWHFSWFSSVSQDNSGIIPILGHHCFLPNYFQLIIHQSSYYSTLYILDTNSVVKLTRKKTPAKEWNYVQGHYKWCGWVEISVFSKRLQIHTWNNLKTTWKLITFIYRCSIFAPLITRQMSTRYSNPSHVRRNCDSSRWLCLWNLLSKLSTGLWLRRLVYLSFTYIHR